MSRRSRLSPRLEALEARTVLSAPTGLAVTLTAVQSGPSAIALTLTETNTTNHDIPVTAGTGVSDFWVTEGGVEVWRKSKDGPQPLGPIQTGVPFHAGQSRSFTAVWKGNIIEGPPPMVAAADVYHASVDGLTADTSTVTAPVVGNLKLTVTASQAVTTVGTPVKFTITETNTSSQPVAVMAYGPESVTVTRGGKPVWRSPVVPIPMLMKLLPPGQSRTLSAVWPGTFNVNRGLPHTGTFTITVRQDNTTATTTLKVVKAQHDLRPIRPEPAAAAFLRGD